MKYINKRLKIENVSIQNIAKTYGTPAYCYSYNKLKENISNFKRNFRSFSPLICFAIKSNTNVNLIREIKKFGLGADVVSKGELMAAIKAGISPKKIVFSGVGKTNHEISYAIDKNIIINFCKNSKNIDLNCLSVHIGSQILDHKPYEKMLTAISNFINQINYKFEYIDLGGGMGISYNDRNRKLNYKRYNVAIKKFLKKHNSKIIFEPGRSIVGSIGTLISQIIYIKNSENKKFVILDTGMNDLMRPALYGASHRMLPSIKKIKKFKGTYEFVGPICESTDKFLNLRKFQELKEKELIAICDVGAYGMSLSSNYNLRTKPIELLIKGSKIKVIRKRQKYTDLI